MENQKIRPTDIVLDKKQHELRMAWADGHHSAYNLDALRKACPCASCKSEAVEEHDPNILKLEAAQSHQVRGISQTGSYALNIVWSDGHQAGFYTWAYLRRICPCEICEAKRAEVDA